MSKRPDSSQLAYLLHAATLGDIDKLLALLGSYSFERSILSEALLTAAEHCTTTSDHLQCVDKLLDAGATVLASTAEGVSVLMLACQHGLIQLVQAICQRGAQVSTQDPELRTALHYAVNTSNGDNGDVIELLLQLGADANACDNQGRAPLHYAAIRGAQHSLKVLLDHGAFVGLQDKARKTALDLAIENDQQVCVKCIQSRPTNTQLPYEEKPQSPHSQGRDVQLFLLSPGPELGEELETKSGSSLSSGRVAPVETDANTSASFKKTVMDVQREIEDKRRELQEEKVRLECAREELHIAEMERSWLVSEMIEAKLFHSNRLHDAEAHSEAESKALTASQSALVYHSPPILTFTKKPVQFNERAIIHNLQEDMCKLISELDTWQSSMSLFFHRAVDRWRGLVTRVLPNAQVKLYGAFATHLHLSTSLIDVVVLNSPFDVVRTLERIEERCRTESIVSKAELALSRYIPALNVTIQSDGLAFQLHVTVKDGKHRGLNGTQTVRNLLSTVPLLRPVFLTLKQLFHYCGVNDPHDGGLGSFGLFLMTAFLMKREKCGSSAEYVVRFLQFFGFECQYLSPIMTTSGGHFETQYQQLVIPDPSAPQWNVARATDLAFLIVSVIQQFLQVAFYNLVCQSACKCETSHHILLKMLQETRTWVLK